MVNRSPEDYFLIEETIDPDAYAAQTATYDGSSIDTLGFSNLTAIVMVGTMASSATLDFHLEDSADNSTFADITSGSITQVTQASPDGSDSKVVMRVDLTGGTHSRYIRGVLTIGTDVVDAAAVLIASGPQDSDLATAFDVTI